MSAARAWASARVVFAKELVDSWRDRRTLLVVLLSSVALGPLLLVALSAVVDGLDRQASGRELLVVGAEHAPTLVNYLQRQSVTVREAPPDHEERLRRQSLGDAVLVIEPGFEATLAAAGRPVVAIVSSSANPRAEASASRVTAWLSGFAAERATLRLAVRGVEPALVQAIEVQERDLADAAARGGQITALLPFFVVLAVLYGALHAALDSTAGERERGSLEPLLTNPAAPWAIALGKWAAVTAVAVAVAVLSVASFLPGQWLLRGEALAALFRFGPREALLFAGLLAPLAAALSALLLAVAIRCRTFKEAQASASVVLLLLSLLPLLSWVQHGAESAWHLHVPVLAEVTLMNRVLRAEPLALIDVVRAAAGAGLVTAAGLAFVSARLRAAAIAAR